VTAEQCELVRVADHDDWNAYHRIRREVLFEDRGLFHGAYDPMHPDNFVASHHPLLMFVADAPVGTVRLDCEANGLGIVRMVAVDGARQRRGHGRRMMALLERYALEQGCVFLEVNSAPDAVEFYQRLGWTLVDAERASPLLRKAL